jgi:hypothetical protein
MRLCMAQDAWQVRNTWDKQGVPRDSIAATSSDLAKASWWLAHPSAIQQGLNQAVCSCTVCELQMHCGCNDSRIVSKRGYQCCCCARVSMKYLDGIQDKK